MTITPIEARKLAPASWPTPDNEIVSAVRQSLGRRRPPAVGREAEPVDRYDLLIAGCTQPTAAVAVLWLNAERRQGRGTRLAYADDLIYWGEWLRQQGHPRLDLAGLTRDHIALWLTHQRSLGRSKATIARRLAALSSLYRYATGYGLPVVSPIHHDDHRPRIKGGRRAGSARVLAPEQVAGMMVRVTDVRDAAILGLLFTDGLRVGELCGASVADYDPDQRTLAVIRKGDSPDEPTRVQIAPRVAAWLGGWAAARAPWPGESPTPLLVDASGGRLTRDGVARTLRRLARAAGIPSPETVTPHSMRASAITKLIRGGWSPTEVQGFTGHADIRTVMTYFDDVAASARNATMAAELSDVVAELPPWLRTTEEGTTDAA